MYYIKIKKSLLLNEDNKKDIMLLWYLYSIESRNEKINFNFNSLVKYYGYTPSTKKNGINTIFKQKLEEYISKKLILIENDINNKNITLKFIKNENNIPICFDYEDDYVMLTNIEMKKILTYYQNNKIKKGVGYIDNIIYFFLVIKSFMNFNKENKPFCFPSNRKLEIFSDLSKQSITNIIKILCDIGLIHRYELGAYITKTGERKICSTIFTLEPVKEETLKKYIETINKEIKKWEL